MIKATTLAAAICLAPIVAFAAGHYCDDAPPDELDQCQEARFRSDDDCTRITDDRYRLICWDSLRATSDCANKYNRPPDQTKEQCLAEVEARYNQKAEAIPPQGMWKQTSSTSNFTDDRNIYLSVPSWDPIQCGRRGKAHLMLRCVEQKTSAVLIHDCYTPTITQDTWPVEIRIGTNPVQQIRLRASSDNDALGWWTYRDARPFIESLFDESKLFVRFRDYSGTGAELEFRIHDLRDAIAPLRKECGW